MARAMWDLVRGRPVIQVALRPRTNGRQTSRTLLAWVPVSLPALHFSGSCLAVAVPALQMMLPIRGIACFRFLNRFTYGNFGDPQRFGLETPE